MCVCVFWKRTHTTWLISSRGGYTTTRPLTGRNPLKRSIWSTNNILSRKPQRSDAVHKRSEPFVLWLTATKRGRNRRIQRRGKQVYFTENILLYCSSARTTGLQMLKSLCVCQRILIESVSLCRLRANWCMITAGSESCCRRQQRSVCSHWLQLAAAPRHKRDI